MQKNNVTIDRDWGIDPVGRKMKYQPYPTDNFSNYLKPSEDEISEIYEISGSAVSETLLYFEECGGNAVKLIEMLNDHMASDKYFVTRETLLDPLRWYNNEFYFYFIMFSKKIIGRYDWHFGENSDKQVSKYHRLYEKGFMGRAPWGEDDEGNKVIDAYISNSLVAFIFIEDFFFLDSTEYLEWINSSMPLRYKLERNLFYTETIPISIEFWYYTMELLNVYLNRGLSYFFDNYYKIFQKMKLTELFLNVPPEEAFNSILKLNTKTTVIFDCKNTLKKGAFKSVVSSNKNLDYSYFGIYRNTLANRHSKMLTACFVSFIYLIFNKYPDYKYSYKLEGRSFVLEAELQWQKSNITLFKYVSFGGLCALAYSALSFILFKGINTSYFILNSAMSIVAGVLLSLMLERLRSVGKQSERFKKLNTKQYSYLEEVAKELSEAKMGLEKKVSDRTKELEEKNRQLKEADILKTRFYTGISHEFKTPLSIILNITENVKDGNFGKKIDNNNKIFDSIEVNSRRLLKLTNNILSWTKFELGKVNLNMKIIDITKIMSIIASLFDSMIVSKGLKYKINMPKESIYIWGDIDLIETALYNLLSNAVKFTEKGCITAGLRRAGDEVIIEVEDTGIGIDEDKIQYIFDPFYRTEKGSERYEGTGLGLAVTKEIVKSLNGDIKCSSIKDKGTSFTIVMSAKEITGEEEIVDSLMLKENYESERRDDKGQIKDINVNSNKTILIVEDNLELSDYLVSFMSDSYLIKSAANGEDALKILESGYESDYDIDLIISDVLMPVMNGIEFFRIVNSQPDYSHIPFLFLTALSEDDEKIMMLKEGAFDYITKPFNYKEIMARVNSILSKIDRNKTKMIDDLKNLIDEFFNETKSKSMNCGPFKDLSKREIEVVECFKRGLEGKEIADTLSISVHTLNNHIQNIYKKLNINNKIELYNLLNNK